MKIALVTIHNAKNYGAILQTFALQEVLLKHGEVDIINYDNRYLSKSLDLIRFEMSIHGVLKLCHDVLCFFPRRRLLRKIRIFYKEKMRLTSIFSKEALLCGNASTYDCYVAGSDQIWNPNILNNSGTLDSIYFLSFAHKDAKKISYATSIGAHKFTAYEKCQITEFLKDFETISVREKGSQMMLQEILAKPVHHVLDPTLLLSKNEWIQQIGLQDEITTSLEKYILLYTVPKTPLIRKAIDFFSKKMGLQVISLEQGLIPMAKVDRQIRDAGMIDFIKLFVNADFVITDSFHGVCFSINFSRPFVAISPGEKSNRIESILSVVGLEKRLVKKEKEFEDMELSIDFTAAQLKLTAARINSLEILSKSFSI
jgi:polysaccharide pyruvyl transferase WcaK-like protein